MDEKITIEIFKILGSAVAGGLITVFFNWLKSRRGNHVIVREISQSEQFKLPKDVRGKFEISYDNERVDKLVLTKLEIVNSGDDLIQSLEITLDVLPELLFIPGDFVDLSIPSTDNNTQLSQKENRKFVIKRDFLKQKKKYPSEKVELFCYSSTPVKFKVHGSGENWDVRYKKRKDNNILYLVVSFAIYLFAMLIYRLAYSSVKPPINIIIVAILVISGIFVTYLSVKMIYQTLKSFKK